MSTSESYYDYTPSVAAAGIFVALFSITGLFHLYKTVTTRTWFCIPLVVGALFETIGFFARALGKSSPTSLPLYITQYLLILLAPILFAATAYAFLARIILATPFPSYSLIRTTWLTKLFVGGDVLCFLIQAVGGGVLASTKTASGADLGKGVILAGLCLQMVVFGFFVVVAAVWQARMKKRGATGGQRKVRFDWERYLKMLYVVSGLITLRNLFRVIEYAMGPEAYLLVNEWPIYVFDALLMLFVLVVCGWWYVGDEMEAAWGEGGGVEMMLETDARTV